MIIDGGYHGITFYEKEVQPDDSRRLAKLNHFASVISSDGKELMKPFKYTYDGDSSNCLSLVLLNFPALTTALSLVLNR